jgi:ATP-dependent DNA ligase
VICCVGKLGQNGGDGRVKLYTMNGADWSKRYPLIVRDAARIDGSAIIDAEVVWLRRLFSFWSHLS